MVQFTWGLYADHGAGYHRTENRGIVSSAKRYRLAKPRSKGSRKDEDKPTSTSLTVYEAVDTIAIPLNAHRQFDPKYRLLYPNEIT